MAGISFYTISLSFAAGTLHNLCTSCDDVISWCVQWGADVTAVNSYAQTPLDLVGKVTSRSNSATREIKLMLQGIIVNSFLYIRLYVMPANLSCLLDIAEIQIPRDPFPRSILVTSSPTRRGDFAVQLSTRARHTRLVADILARMSRGWYEDATRKTALVEFRLIWIRVIALLCFLVGLLPTMCVFLSKFQFIFQSIFLLKVGFKKPATGITLSFRYRKYKLYKIHSFISQLSLVSSIPYCTYLHLLHFKIIFVYLLRPSFLIYLLSQNV